MNISDSSETRNLFEPKFFKGNLRLGIDGLAVSFTACINQSGEVVFDFDEIELNQNSTFIAMSLQGNSSYFKEFTLIGKSDDDTEFKTKHLYVNSLGHNSSGFLNISASCSEAFFFLKSSLPTPPFIRLHLKGFQNFRQLKTICDIGTVVMDGDNLAHNNNIFTGDISITPENELIDFSEWRTKADKLLEHIRLIMSFATASALQAPTIEYFDGAKLEVVVLSQTDQLQPFMRTFHHLHQQPIFEAAVRSFFNPPIEINNLYFTIEWFSMNATYNEIRLVAAMTALENLVSSNLNVTDIHIRPEKEFNKKPTPEGPVLVTPKRGYLALPPKRAKFTALLL